MDLARRLALAAAVALGIAHGAVAAAGEKEPCADGRQRVGDLGILSLDCDCTYSGRSVSSDGHVTRVRRWVFRSEPEVSALRTGGPAAGKLREGDVITAIDGVLITTREGSRRFVAVTPGAPATLTVRREGREFPVRIVADAVCPDKALTPESGLLVMSAPQAPEAPQAPQETLLPELAWTVETSQAPEAPEAPQAPETPEAPRRAPRAARLPMSAIPTEDALPRGWSGFAITGQKFGGRPGQDGGPPVWEFGMLPTIWFIEPGSPAARAGMQIGDVLTQIDGVSLLTEEAGRRFGALKPGQNVRWTIRRGGSVRTLTVVTEPPPGERSVPLAELQERLRALSEQRDAQHMSSEMQRLAREMERTSNQMARKVAREASRDRLRYAGAVGGSEIEVRGLQNVVVDDDGDEIVITTRDATIRIKKAAAAAPKQEKKR